MGSSKSATMSGRGNGAGVGDVVGEILRNAAGEAVKGGSSLSDNFKAAQVIHLAKGGTLTVTNNDVMSHQLIKTSGPAVTIKLTNPGAAGTGKLRAPYATGLMPHMGATVRVSFSKPGVYKFTTKEGDDYYPGIKTTGPDKILRATIVVS